MKLIKLLISAVYPNKCIGCGEIIKEDVFLCDYCDKNIEKNNFDDFCLLCGNEKENCVCKFNVYRFEKLVTVFKNTGIAQNAYYSYKFKRNQHYSEFFAAQITDAINRFYGEVKFDFLCAVPASRGVFSTSQYNHCRYLGESVSNKLKITFADKLLVCKGVKKQQHKLPIKKRLINVNDKFDCTYRVDGATVLLIDDIRTTGATLDECSKTLLYAGAESVYCVTVLGAVTNKKEN